MGRPLTVLQSNDSTALEQLFATHAPGVVDVLDCTYNKGIMWKGVSEQTRYVWRSDVDASFDLDLVADFRKLPLRPHTIDVIIFDPPHLPADADSPGASRMWARQYGIACGKTPEDDSVSSVFLPFLMEARRILRSDGVIFAKIADLVHNHRYQWQQVEFVCAAQHAGMTACDMLIKCDPRAGKLMSSKWQTVYHFRKAHCYWIVVRNGRRCERRHKE